MICVAMTSLYSHRADILQITSYTTQSTSSVLPSTLPTTLFPQNTFHTLNNVLLVAGVIAAIVVFSLVVLILILVLVIARVKSKKTVHLESRKLCCDSLQTAFLDHMYRFISSRSL